ncbi:hypothetical protein [Saccharopolyspora phatthalungensis]|uniref:Uncharacterized protein n=1 Tax=Saccharopolyspora phatthalungensis TaxID=664693 RepID=A0A840Q571_9PSEU|nr:hypothetical protein [Saccharopolyspora phatthalungensis]MBB5155616.1 hypothetical protein [Saccharopolyspora phatthalungensis]
MVSSKAFRIFGDYVLALYFPANGLTVAQRLRCALPLLLIEHLVYQVDAITEGARAVDLDTARNQDYVALHEYKAKFVALLRRMRAYNDAVAKQIEAAEQYVRIENRVTSNGVLGHAEAMRLAELRPSDVRLLHGMVFALLRQPVDDHLLRLLWPVEVLADLANDLAHYPRDLVDKKFNTYAVFVKLYGAEAPTRMRAEIERYEAMFRAELERFPRARQMKLASLCAKRYGKLTSAIPAPLPQDGYLSPIWTEVP